MAVTLWQPNRRLDRIARGAQNVDRHMGRPRLGILHDNGQVRSRLEFRQDRLQPLDRDIPVTINQGPQFVIAQRVRRDGRPGLQVDLQFAGFAAHVENVERTRLAAQHLVGRLSRAIDIDHTVDALLQRAPAAIADMRAVVVVTEENQSRDVIPLRKTLSWQAGRPPRHRLRDGPACRRSSRTPR